jgi:hypothetical protein
VLIGFAKLVAPQPRVTFPAWQGMQYMRDMFTGSAKLAPLDNDRYAGILWTSVRDQLARTQNVSHMEARTSEGMNR